MEWGQFLSVVMGGVLATAGGVVTHYLQSRSERSLNVIQLRQAEQQTAVGVMLNVADEFGSVAAHATDLLRLTLGAAETSKTDPVRALLDSAYSTWRSHVLRARLLESIYFPQADTSRNTVEELDRQVDTLLALVNEAAHRQGELRVSERELRGLEGHQDFSSHAMRESLRARVRALHLEDTLGLSRARFAVFKAYHHLGEWRLLIAARLTGTSDPMARFLMNPREELEYEADLRRRIAGDTVNP